MISLNKMKQLFINKNRLLRKFWILLHRNLIKNSVLCSVTADLQIINSLLDERISLQLDATLQKLHLINSRFLNNGRTYTRRCIPPDFFNLQKKIKGHICHSHNLQIDWSIHFCKKKKYIFSDCVCITMPWPIQDDKYVLNILCERV